jgi:hypothetical protein
MTLVNDPTLDKVSRRRQTFDGEYSEGHCRSTMLKFERGRFQLGFLQGYYRITKQTATSVDLDFIHGFFEDRKHPDKYRLTRRKTTYVLTNLANGTERLFKRKDKKVFLCDSFLTPTEKKRLKATVGNAKSAWKRVESAAAKVYFQLTGDSVLHGATIPEPPSSKTPTVVRVSHSNSYGRVNSDIFVRLGDPKKPLDVQDFDTVSDWRKAALVEDLLWSDEREQWVLAVKAKGDTSVWCGTYEAEFQFPKGHHQIELKIISRVPEVCSIVLSNWKVYVR